MKKSMVAATIALAFGIGFGTAAQAEEVEAREQAWSPVGVGIFDPVQFPDAGHDIYGLRFGGILGRSASVWGLDLGLAEISTGDMFGLQASAFSWTGNRAFGAQFGAFANMVSECAILLQGAGAANIVYGDAYGIQLAGVSNYANTFTGLQLASIVNWNVQTSYGFQAAVANADQFEFFGGSVGALNYAGKLRGCQIGAFNLADEVHGVQIGIINACDRMKGVQIGAINLISESVLPVFPVVNGWF